MILERYAAIDIGSNGVRLLIMNVVQDKKKTHFIKTMLVRAPIRLGEDSFENNEIKKETMEMLAEAMKSFASLMKVYKVVAYRACATSALRESSNQKEVINYLKKESGIKVELIDGSEEAEIIYRTQVKDLIQDKGGYLFIDVGGGSTEVTYYFNKKTIASKSFKIGSVRLFKKLVEDIEWTRLAEYLQALKIDPSTIAVGTGGNINTIFKKSEKQYGKPLSMKYLMDSHREIGAMGIDQRIIEYRFNPDRADVIIPALEIYIRIMKKSGIKEIRVPKIGLADGLIKDLYQRKNG